MTTISVEHVTSDVDLPSTIKVRMTLNTMERQRATLSAVVKSKRKRRRGGEGEERRRGEEE